MKTILALATALFVGSDMADDPRHMIEFNAENLLQTTLGISKTKSRGNSAENDTQLKFDMNYAYSLPWIPQLQLGGRVNYNKGAVAGRGDSEDYGLGVQAYWNFTGPTGSLDLNN